MKIDLQRMHYMPQELKPGVLYVSEEFGAAAHLCPCGCGAKIRTPLGPTDWTLEETDSGPTLWPSVGNWQQTCQSHYWIYEGEVIWSIEFTPGEIASGCRSEAERRRAYYHALHRQRGTIGRRFRRWVKRLFQA